MKDLEKIFVFFKNHLSNGPLIKLIGIISISIGICNTIIGMFCTSIKLPKVQTFLILVIISIIVLFALLYICIIPPKIKNTHTIVCLVLDMPSLKKSYAHYDTDIVPFLKNALSNCTVVSTNYLQSIFYSVMFSSLHGENYVKNLFKKFFCKKSGADLILVGNAKIKSGNNDVKFECYCNVVLNPTNNNNFTNVEKLIEEHDTLHLTFNIDNSEEKSSSLSNFSNILSCLIQYNPKTPDIISKISKIIKENANQKDPILQQNVDNMIVWMINDISNYSPDIASTKQFITLCNEYLKSFHSVIVLNTKHYYEMILKLANNANKLQHFKQFAKNALNEMQNYNDVECGFLCNKAFLNLILDNVGEAEELYGQAIQLKAFNNQGNVFDVFGFLDIVSNHNILCYYGMYAKAYCIMKIGNGIENQNDVRNMFADAYDKSPRRCILHKNAKKHIEELKNR